MTTIAPLLAVGAAGIVAGTLANRAIDRMQRETAQPDADPRCRCQLDPPSPLVTDRRIPVAVVDTFLHRGTCACCGRRQRLRPLVVELSTAALFVVLTVRLVSLDLLPALPAYLYFATVAVALTVIDIDCKRLPNFLVLPSYPAVFTLLAFAAAVQGDWPALLRAAVGAAALFGFYLVLALVHPAGMGLGDVKLAGVIGAVLAFVSYGAFVLGALLAFVFAAIAGAVLLITRRALVGTTIPFGPYMIAAALVGVVAAEPLGRAYLSWRTGA
ncbi:prepilin peptidase [Rhodococcus spongiicola]|uniref:prepilin peptidase n=1 Tax=Rhodococcus spongiicola TaxID=2487352 RepID=UPI001F47800E|nr:A24 family peptidase [Rhodococcus spongiicola]